MARVRPALNCQIERQNEQTKKVRLYTHTSIEPQELSTHRVRETFPAAREEEED